MDSAREDHAAAEAVRQRNEAERIAAETARAAAEASRSSAETGRRAVTHEFTLTIATLQALVGRMEAVEALRREASKDPG